MRQGVSSLLEIPTDSCRFFCTPSNPCATPIVTRGEGSFSYQGVSTRAVSVFSGNYYQYWFLPMLHPDSSAQVVVKMSLPIGVSPNISKTSKTLKGPNWGLFFCPEIRAFTGFRARFLQAFPKSLVTVKYYSNTIMAINSRQWPLIAVNGGHAGTKKAPIGATQKTLKISKSC